MAAFKMITLPPPNINTWQSPFELELLLLHFRHHAPKRVLELGSADGGTIWCWAHNCQPGTHILSVDWWKPDAGYPDNRSLYGHWAIRNTCSVDWIAGDTRDADTIKRVRAFGPFDWIFIDAGHGIKEVTADWENYSPMAMNGGVVVFHDITPVMQPNYVEVRLLWDKLKAGKKHVEIFENNQDDKLGVGLLYV